MRLPVVYSIMLLASILSCDDDTYEQKPFLEWSMTASIDGVEWVASEARATITPPDRGFALIGYSNKWHIDPIRYSIGVYTYNHWNPNVLPLKAGYYSNTDSISPLKSEYVEYGTTTMTWRADDRCQSCYLEIKEVIEDELRTYMSGSFFAIVYDDLSVLSNVKYIEGEFENILVQ